MKSIAMWFYTKKKALPQSAPDLVGNYFIIENVTIKNGGYYYCSHLLPDGNGHSLQRMELRILGN